MQKILHKRVIRDLKKNIFRYLALGLLIVLGMFLVISIVGAAETIMEGTKRNQTELQMEDGEFCVFVPLTEKELKKLEDSGAVIEAMFYLDYTLENNSTLRVFADRKKMNLVALDNGTLPKKENDVVLEKRYCQEHEISVGDKLTIGSREFTVTGIGSSPDYEAPYRNTTDSSADSMQFGTAFVTDDVYELLKNGQGADKSEEYLYAYRLTGSFTEKEFKEELKKLEFSSEDVEDEYFQEYWNQTAGKKDEFVDALWELDDGAKKLRDALEELTDYNNDLQRGARLLMNFYEISDLQAYSDSVTEYTDAAAEIADGFGELYNGIRELRRETTDFLDEYLKVDVSNLTMFLPAEDNPRIGAAGDDQVINKYAGLAAGVIVLVLFTYVISVFVIHGIEQEISVIGALYALGVKREEIIIHYLMLPVAVTFVSGIIGTGLGYSSLGVRTQMADCYLYFSLPDLNIIYSPYLLIYGLVLPSLIAVLVNYFVIRGKLSQPALKMIRNEQKAKKVKEINLGNIGFIRRFQIRQMLREVRTGFTVCFGMFVCMMIMMLAVNCYVLCEHISVQNKEDTKFSYMYTYKYPTEEPPEGGVACYAKTLKKEVLGYNLDITVLGIEKKIPYFDVTVEKGESRVWISSAMAQKYSMEEGDKIILSDEEEDRDYAFTVEGIVPYSTSFYAFMDIESMRALFGAGEDYYNVVFSDEALDIESGRLYASLTKEEIDQSADVFVDMMMPMVVMMTAVSVLIFMVVMYLMMKVMIDRSAFHISLMKIFGYRTGEIRKLYLNGNFYIIAISAAICLPLSKMVMDAMYPYMISNIACGFDLTFPWQLYAGIYLVTLALYFVINQVLVGRLKKQMPAEVLKNRE